VALKKPTDIFSKEEEMGVFSSPEASLEIKETYNRFRNNLDKVNILFDKVEQISYQLSEKLNRTDLEDAMLSQLVLLDDNFKSFQTQIKGLNKEDLREFKTKVSNLTEIVEGLIEDDFPKYKKQITKNQIDIDEKFNTFKEDVEDNISYIREDIDTKFSDIAEVVDTNLEHFNNHLKETSFKVKQTTDTYNKLSKIIENKVVKENEKLEEFSQIIRSLYETFVELETSLQEKNLTHLQIIEEKFENISSSVNERLGKFNEEVKTFENNISEELLDVKSGVVINEKHLKKVEEFFQENYKELIDLKEEVLGELEKLSYGDIQENVERLNKKIQYIEEVYKNIEPEVIIKEVIREGSLNEPPSTKNKDPLTPLNQNFVTLDQLQQHYRLFLNRIQQQLSTLGGGGETRLKYLDDIVGIATNASAYDGKFLKYNHSIGKFEFVTVSGGGSGSQTLNDTLILGNTSSLGMSVGIITATGFRRTVGTSTEFLKADGSVDISTYATQSYVGLATAGLASTSYVGLATAGLASTSYVGLATVGLASTSYVDFKVGISTAGLASTSYVGLATVGLLNSTGNGSSLTGIVTFIGAGSEISINQNTGNVIISVETINSFLLMGA
jgi:hypothetical protein